MKIDLTDTTSSNINKALVQGGAPSARRPSAWC